jgi:NhaA family Na+:H+ antiporter
MAHSHRRIALPGQVFVSTEVFSALVLLGATVLALAWANSAWYESYFRLVHEPLSIDLLGIVNEEKDVQHWINDGLMTIFFLVVGMEIKRELVRGELRGLDKALLPALAALGGMVAPAAVYLALNAGGDGEAGWGIPMATDIAFALGLLAIIGSRIPAALRVFLLALAIVDDIGAILVIALFYTEDIDLLPLFAAAGLLGAMFVMTRLHVTSLFLYSFAGLAVWVSVLESGVHATIAGVALGLLVPVTALRQRDRLAGSLRDLLDRFRGASDERDYEMQEQLLGEMEELIEESEAPVDRLVRTLHPVSSFVIVPLFAFANAGVRLDGDAVADSLDSTITLGIVLGLVLGKPIGIFTSCWAASRLGLARLPEGVTWPQLLGVGVLAGVGFTVALFVNELAFDEETLIEQGKIGILAASVCAGILGLASLIAVSPRGEEAPRVAGPDSPASTGK